MLSVIIITKNEAHNIGQCLEAVAWADEVIVLDSGSEDDTVAISRQYTNKVFETDWQGFGVQKQRALEKAKGDWVLSIDADEIVTAELKEEIRAVITRPELNGYEIPRLSNYCGKPMRHGGWWPDYVLRLFRRDSGRFSEALVHERVFVDGKIGRLNAPLIHDKFVNLDEVLHKINYYSTLGAEMLYRKGVRSSLGKALSHGVWMFFRTYFIKLAFLEGWRGVMLSISTAEETYYKYIKLLDLQCRQAMPK
jgi:glycosyltransferase involved in cell wall biosynthesis